MTIKTPAALKTEITSNFPDNTVGVITPALLRTTTTDMVDTAAGGGNVFNVKAYGAVGDGVTDDTSAVNLAIAAFNAAGAGRLYFPASTYLVSSALTAITAQGIVEGDGHAQESQGLTGATNINFSSSTAVLFTVNTQTHLLFQNLNLKCTATATAGAAISVFSSQGAMCISYSRLSISRFFIGIDSQVGEGWVMDQCFIGDCVSRHVKVQNTVAVDGGDWFISNCYFNVSSVGPNNSIGLRCESSGGGKVVNCKFVGSGSGHTFDKSIDIEGSGNTSDFQVVNCSIEGFNTAGILSNGDWEHITITNCQFVATPANSIGISIINNNFIAISNCVVTLTSGAASISASGVSNIAISNCILAGTTAAALSISNSNQVTVTGCVLSGTMTSAAVLSNVTNTTVCNCVTSGTQTNAFDLSGGATTWSVLGITTTASHGILAPDGTHRLAYSDLALDSWVLSTQILSRGAGAAFAFDDQTTFPGHAWQLYSISDILRIWNQLASGNKEVLAVTSAGLLQQRSGGQTGWTASTTDPTAALDTAIARPAGALMEVNNGTAAGFAQLRLNAVNVSALPSPSATYTGARATVNNANATFTAGIGAVVAGGGANTVPVFCDGTNWRIG